MTVKSVTVQVSDGAVYETATISFGTPPTLTMGETTVLGSNVGGFANLLIAQQATLSQAATLQSLSLYVSPAAGKIRIGVYDATGPSGGPGHKVAETAEVTPAIGWNTAPITSPILLQPGTYWLAFLPSAGGLGLEQAGSGTARWYGFPYGTLPSTFATAGVSSGAMHWSLYATLTAGTTVIPMPFYTGPFNVLPPQTQGDVIAANRSTTWQPGLTFNATPASGPLAVVRDDGTGPGIPVRNTIYLGEPRSSGGFTIPAPLGSGQDDSPSIQAAIVNCPAGQVVLLGPGIYNINTYAGITGLWINRSNITLRGSGVSSSGANGGDWVNNEFAGHPCPGTSLTTSSGTMLRKVDRASDPNAAVIACGWAHDWPTANTNFANLAQNTVLGSKQCVLSSIPTGLTVGEMVRIDHNTDTDPDIFWGPNSDPPKNPTPVRPFQSGDGSQRSWFCPPSRSLCQIMLITAINGNTITFETPFHWVFKTAYGAQLCRYGDGAVNPTLTGIGIENLCLAGGRGGEGAANCTMNGVAYSWFSNIESYYGEGNTICFSSSYRCELRDSYLHEVASPTPGGAGYLCGMVYGTSDSLFENNIMWSGDKNIVMKATGGGNVIAYNYMDDSFGWAFPDSPEAGVNAGHFCGPHMELIEGNYSHNYKGDMVWGASPYITVFRNHLSGIRAGAGRTGQPLGGGGKLISYTYFDAGNNRTVPYGDYGGHICVDIQGGSYNNNIVGNVLGFSGMAIPHFSGGGYVDGNGTSYTYEVLSIAGFPISPSIWQIGSQQTTSNWQWDPTNTGQQTYLTLQRDGNWDWLNSRQIWLGIGGTGTSNLVTPKSIPSSLYLPSKPSFFGSNPWPWVDPSSGATYTLPAKERFRTIMGSQPAIPPGNQS